ncbi:MAG: methyltransferase [Clostridiales bacterium]|nr:methyltransferase [Clostridiales bacterium]
MEKIGNVILDDVSYPGEDLYSEGPGEDLLLEIARDCPPEEYNKKIRETQSWPVMYHFSNIRPNLVSWLPIKKTDRVLEIGSGCGAVTGALAEKAGTVHCIDLSRKRSQINAYRNKSRENVTIFLGNFQDVEKRLADTYDYITLIGVLEYAASYLPGEKPWVRMLEMVRRHLAPGGRIVVAIENRLGLKYWAGCAEDHVGRYFEGIEDYPHTEGVRTFSRKEWKKIFRELGMRGDFYYPYPDYKLPTVIYSDRRLPEKGELTSSLYNFDRSRVELFDEALAFDGLIGDGLFPQFANSFLILLEETAPGVVYSRISNQRLPEFSIETDILQKKKKRWVRKQAVEAQGRSHIEGICDACEGLERLFQGTELLINRCVKTDEGVKLEYLTGGTLLEQLDLLKKQGKTQEMTGLFRRYLNLIRETAQERFTVTDEFEEVFGTVPKREKYVTAPVTDIDMVLSNVLVDSGGRWHLLDYEWTFFFPVPIQFVIYRILSDYENSSLSRNQVSVEELYEDAGIDGEDREIFRRMEENFQRYVQGDYLPLPRLYPLLSPGHVDLGTLLRLEAESGEERLQIFTSRDGTLREEDSRRYAMPGGKAVLWVEIPEEVSLIRMDPGEKACRIRIERMEWQDGRKCDFYTNGESVGEKEILFKDRDPQIYVDHLPRGRRRLFVELTRDQVVEDYALEQIREREERLQEQEEENRKLRRQLEEKEKQIRAMEETKVWKAYRKYKKFGGK